jgi:hypothetical protein
MDADKNEKIHQLVVDTFNLPDINFEILHPDAPITLDDALFLPELGGDAWSRSVLVTIHELRSAVRRGDLLVERHGKNFRTTRRYIADWREKCRVHPNQSACGSDLPARQRAERQSGNRSSLSSTQESRSALDVAQMIVQELKRR